MTSDLKRLNESMEERPFSNQIHSKIKFNLKLYIIHQNKRFKANLIHKQESIAPLKLRYKRPCYYRKARSHIYALINVPCIKHM